VEAVAVVAAAQRPDGVLVLVLVLLLVIIALLLVLLLAGWYRCKACDPYDVPRDLKAAAREYCWVGSKVRRNAREAQLGTTDADGVTRV
jgi:hypothetical protein